MDNYYNLFKGDSGSKRKASKKSSSYSRRPSHSGGTHFNFGILKILFYIAVLGILAFLLLMIFSSNLTYESANETNIEEYLTELTKNERVAGTENEISAAKYINDKMTEWGYESKLDGFEILPYDGKTFARNVIAVKNADAEYDTGDILIVTAHFDSENGSVGANNNASGAAALMELANVLKAEKTDTKLMFVFLSATYESERGTNYFINTFGNDKEKIIGVIDIDSIGIDTKPLFKLITSDLKNTVTSQILNEYTKRITKNELEITYSAQGTHEVFTSNKVPAVTITSKANSMYNGLSLDTMDKLNTVNIKKVTDICENTLREIMKFSTTSYLEMSKSQNQYDDNVFVMTKDTEIPFGSTKEEVEEKMKFKGTFAGTDTDANGQTIDLYSYKMKWFNLNKLLETKYEYTNTLLTSVKTEMNQSNITYEELLRQMSEYLKLSYKTNVTDQGANVYIFEDIAGRKLYTITTNLDDTSYTVDVTNYYTEDTIYSEEDLYTAVNNNNELGASREEKLLNLISKILMPRDIKRVNNYITFTDGIGYKKGYVMPADVLNNNKKFTYAIDIDDAFDSDGNYRNYKETLETIINNYAYILALNESQVTLTETPATEKIYLFDNGVYQDTAYLKLFKDNFYKVVRRVTTIRPRVTQVVSTNVTNDDESNADADAEDTSSETNNSNETVPVVQPVQQTQSVVVYENETSGEEIMSSFADSFVEFILNTKDDAQLIANEKVLFFYNFEELVNIREYIRNNLGL